MKTGVSKKDNDKPQIIPNFIRTFVDFEYFLKTETFYVFVTIKKHTVS